jgi:trk system potassium uptake protein TrkA
MKVIICGAGQVGWQIARHLSGEKNDVTIVDTNADLVRRATETLDVQGVVGFASHPDVLARAGARDADMIIAATHSDEVNMVCCQIAQAAFDITRKIARIRAQSLPGYRLFRSLQPDRLAIDVVISPEREVAEAALQRLAAPATFDTEVFMGGRAQLLGIQLSEDCPVLNTPLRQLNELFSTLRAIVVGIRRDGRLFAPDPGDQLEPRTRSMSSPMSRTSTARWKSSARRPRSRSGWSIIGGGNVGLTVARALEARSDRMRAKIIEKNRATAERPPMRWSAPSC